jgi:hypothetical protein
MSAKIGISDDEVETPAFTRSDTVVVGTFSIIQPAFLVATTARLREERDNLMDHVKRQRD